MSVTYMKIMKVLLLALALSLCGQFRDPDVVCRYIGHEAGKCSGNANFTDAGPTGITVRHKLNTKYPFVNAKDARNIQFGIAGSPYQIVSIDYLPASGLRISFSAKVKGRLRDRVVGAALTGRDVFAQRPLGARPQRELESSSVGGEQKTNQ